MKNKTLSELKVGISISESSDLQKLGLSKYHIQDALIEFSRYLLAAGATVVYGGDVRYNEEFNFAQMLIDIVQNYNAEYNDTAEKIINYAGYPISKTIDVEEEASLRKIVKLNKLSIAHGLKESDYGIDELFKLEKIEHQFVWAKCMTDMREQMNNETDARILMAGKVSNYKGKMPGVIEEAYLALRENKPLYIIGAFGGAGKVVIDALGGISPTELTSKYQAENNKYSDFETYYNKNVEDSDKLDYPKLCKLFNDKGISSLNNGLSVEENEELFTSNDIHKLVSLVLKGLKNIYQQK